MSAAPRQVPSESIAAPRQVPSESIAAPRQVPSESAAGTRHDLPEPDAFTRVYWDAAARGRLLLRRCGACGRAHHYPREFCPHCWSEDVVWEPASGRAALYTWSVVHRNDLPPFGGRTPYVAAVIDLAEGPRMMTEVVECPHEELRAGMALEVAFRDGAGVHGGADVQDGAHVQQGEGAQDGVAVQAGALAVPVFRPRR